MLACVTDCEYFDVNRLVIILRTHRALNHCILSLKVPDFSTTRSLTPGRFPMTTLVTSKSLEFSAKHMILATQSALNFSPRKSRYRSQLRIPTL